MSFPTHITRSAPLERWLLAISLLILLFITSQITTHFTGSAALERWRHTTYYCAHITTQMTTHFTNKLRVFSDNTPYYYSLYDRSRILLPVFRAHWQTGGLQSEHATLPRHKRRRVGIGLAAAVIWVVRWGVIWVGLGLAARYRSR